MPTLSSDQRGAIRDKAEHTLGRYRGFGQTFEVLQKIAKDEGIEVLEADLHDISGALRHEQSKWRIYINRQDAPTRQVFTLAHELGHYFLHRTLRSEFVDGEFVMYRDDDSRFESEELEANEFAGNLVMPRARIEHMLQGKDVTEERVLKLADLFCVSPLAIFTRLRTLGYELPKPAASSNR